MKRHRAEDELGRGVEATFLDKTPMKQVMMSLARVHATVYGREHTLTLTVTTPIPKPKKSK